MKRKKEFTKHPYESTEFNTNNAWGFGGAYGTSYKFPKGDLELRVGTACYRHTGTSKYHVLIFQGVRVLDRSGHNLTIASKYIDAIMTDQYQEMDEPPYIKLIGE